MEKIEFDIVAKKYNVIFAFNESQFKEQYNKNMTPYIHMGAGAYIPKSNYKDFNKEWNETKKNNIEVIKQNKSNYKIAFDLFMNYELQYSYLDDEHILELKEYGIPEKDCHKYFDRFMNYCSNNDLI